MEWQARRVRGAAGAWQAKVMPSFKNPMRFLEEVEPEPAPLAEMQAWCGAAFWAVFQGPVAGAAGPGGPGGSRPACH